LNVKAFDSESFIVNLALLYAFSIIVFFMLTMSLSFFIVGFLSQTRSSSFVFCSKDASVLSLTSFWISGFGFSSFRFEVRI